MKRIFATFLLAFYTACALAQVPIYTRPQGVNSAAVAITGGSITGVSGVPYTISQSAIPFIALSSGSIAANGAITAITALPAAYANAYCALPANALSGASAAGYYFCQFSTATAGTAFLNLYTSGTPTIPGSPTPVVAGQGAFTGVSTEVFGPIVNVPGNALGANGELQVFVNWTVTNTAAAKTTNVRYSGTAGTLFMNGGPTSQASRQDAVLIQNRGVTNSQVGTSNGQVGGFGQNGSVASTYSAVDTTAATTVVFGMVNSTPATNNVVVEKYRVNASVFP